jgi:hypothetical protein
MPTDMTSGVVRCICREDNGETHVVRVAGIESTRSRMLRMEDRSAKAGRERNMRTSL